MNPYPSDIAFTAAVKAMQTARGSRSTWAKVEQGRGWQTCVNPELAAFLGEMDMFYFATANSQGQPYVQYRGGSPGFLRVLDEQTLGFADLAGNRQYVTIGNLSENPRAFIFLMDYVNQTRIKLWGTARVVDGDAELLSKLADPHEPGRPERAILFTIAAWDVNCPKHIHRRIPESQVTPVVEKLQARIAELQERIRQLES
jgi:predicted pyridoxine 5'-phosphate oxidase superfamily flavin-nucleotide-binding protein